MVEQPILGYFCFKNNDLICFLLKFNAVEYNP